MNITYLVTAVPEDWLVISGFHSNFNEKLIFIKKKSLKKSLIESKCIRLLLLYLLQKMLNNILNNKTIEMLQSLIDIINRPSHELSL